MNKIYNSPEVDKCILDSELSIQNIIFSDAKQEILHQSKALFHFLNINHLKAEKICINDADLFDHIDVCFQNYRGFLQKYHKENQVEYDEFDRLQTKMQAFIVCINHSNLNADEKEAIQKHCQSIQNNFVAECVFHYTQGVENGIKLVQLHMDTIQNKEIYMTYEKLFHPEYRYDFLFPAFYERYQDMIFTYSMEKATKLIHKKFGGFGSEWKELFDEVKFTIYMDDTSEHLYKMGINEGIKLIYKLIL